MPSNQRKPVDLRNTLNNLKPRLSNLLLLMTLPIAIAGCSSFQKSSEVPKTTAAAPSKVSPEVIEADFEPETLYALLAAEMAGQRNRFDITLLNYVQQAQHTKDLGVIKRALQVSQFLKSQNALIDLSHLWLEQEPDSLEPMQILAFQYTRKGDFESAIKYMERIYQLGGHADFESLAILAKNLPPEDQEKLESLYKTLTTRYPENFEMGYGYSLIQRSRENYAAALDTINRYLELDPEFKPGILLQATLLYDMGEMQKALRVLAKASRKYPEDRKLGTLYARMLVDDGQLERSEEEYNKLLKRFPDVPGLKLAHALIALEIGKYDIAQTELTELLEEGQHVNEAHFYLARSADQRKEIDLAIDHYRQVESGSHYFNALSRSGYLRAKNGALNEVLEELSNLRAENPAQSAPYWQVEINLLLDLDETSLALKTVTAALEQDPENTNLIYSRAMLNDRLGNLTEMESDLRLILSREPENAVALNALGYTLADKTDRYFEAFELINKALQLNPGSPAVLDSLGWVYFRMGNIEQALVHINEAYQKYPDPEVAAHLGEILWSIDRKSEALDIWRKAANETPDHRILTETLKRLNVKL
ncbi:MAG: tetratricopeptide repeat protein [Hahellaceae bacterium]|nr:tetratricopeptide repeat protein [Hahellaceae bacterium]MCP5212439.1 tetratricopeptide repeat protein [Hahellaceae bacterium]